MNRLFYGDNLVVLRNRRDFPDESVDLIYLDPPFNSKKTYNVLFQHKSGEQAQAQIEAFDDTWTWSQEAQQQYAEMLDGGAPPQVAAALQAMRRLLGENDVLAYVVMMTARLVELHRVLKPTGSLYLHCDPTASHYLRIILDSVFGHNRYLNEIVWCYREIGSTTTAYYKRKHDTILVYAKGDTWTHNPQRGQLSESTIKRYGPYFDANGQITYRALQASNPGVFAKLKGVPDDLDEVWIDINRGGQLPDWWTDISALKRGFQEALGYPTQKPVALLERIIRTSSNEGDTVLDPFCGCGTTIDAAHRLQRSWTGIDITYLAIDLIQRRLDEVYGPDVRSTYEVRGVPREMEAAQALFDQNTFDFERWAVSLVTGTPNQKRGGDKGIDGRIRFHLNADDIGEVLVSVKGGRQLNPAMVRELRGTVEREQASMGVLIVLGKPTRGMIDEAAHSGYFHYAFSGANFPRIQIISVADLLKGAKVQMPTPISPYRKARPRSGQLDLELDLDLLDGG